MFDKQTLKGIIGLDEGQVPLALVFMGKAKGEGAAMPRKTVGEKIRYLR
jgi:hypothetical protein